MRRSLNGFMAGGAVALCLTAGLVRNHADESDDAGNGEVVRAIQRVAVATTEPTPIVPVPRQDLSMSLEDYARLIVDRVAEIPPLDSRKAVVIPVKVNGKIPDRYEPDMVCDQPALLPLTCSGQCVPYSRIQLLRDDDEAQMVALFRRKIIRPEEDPLFDEIDLIVHSVVTGDTGWFQATPRQENPDCDPTIGLNGHRVPVPQARGAGEFWNSPQTVVKADCARCHDNDPFYYSPYIAQVINHVPANPLGKYNNAIGPFRAWKPLRSLSTRGNTCTGCHRIGTQFTSKEGLLEATGATKAPQGDKWALTYPGSHWMPAHNFLTKEQWDTVYSQSAEDLLNWHRNPDVPGYIVKPIPGGSE